MTRQSLINRYRAAEKDAPTLPRRDGLFDRYYPPREFGALLANWPWDEALARCRHNRMDEREFAIGYNGHPPAVHFVAFQGDEYIRAIRVWGRPDFIHRVWDHRVMDDVAPGDTVVFAKGDETWRPSEYTFNDSAVL